MKIKISFNPDKSKRDQHFTEISVSDNEILRKIQQKLVLWNKTGCNSNYDSQIQFLIIKSQATVTLNVLILLYIEKSNNFLNVIKEQSLCSI